MLTMMIVLGFLSSLFVCFLFISAKLSFFLDRQLLEKNGD